jgi:dolichol-phosphate mannosyltransferase
LKAQKERQNNIIDNQSKNFGQEIAMTAGLNYVAEENKSDENDFAVIFMDADLQHPPEIVVELIELWEN